MPSQPQGYGRGQQVYRGRDGRTYDRPWMPPDQYRRYMEQQRQQQGQSSSSPTRQQIIPENRRLPAPPPRNNYRAPQPGKPVPVFHGDAQSSYQPPSVEDVPEDTMEDYYGPQDDYYGSTYPDEEYPVDAS